MTTLNPRSVWHIVAAVSGATAVSMGAYGAHAFRPTKDPEYFRNVYDRGSQYHLLHSLLLAVAPLARRPNVVGGLASAGILMFSGTCYTVALTQNRANSKLAPFGGFAFIGAWLALAL